MASDPWSVLGVGRDASREELRSAYRRLASKLHPDRLATAPAAERRAAEERLQVVGEAYALARAAVDAREGSPTGATGAGGSFADPPPFAAGRPGQGTTAEAPCRDWDLAGEGRPGPEEAPDGVAHPGWGCGLIAALLVAVIGVVVVATALLTGGRSSTDAPALAPWRLAPIRASAAPVAYDAWRTSPAAGVCRLIVPASVRGAPDTALVPGGWSGDWAGVGITTRADRNDVPVAGPGDVALVWTDGSRGLARPAGGTGWTAVFVINGETCRHEVRADGDFDDLARVLGGLRRVTTSEALDRKGS